METALWQRGTSALGLLSMVGIAWLMSSRRDRVPWRVIGWGLGLQIIFGVLVLKTTPGLWLFELLNVVMVTLLGFTDEGARFVFGPYLDKEFSLALNVLPTIVFFSSLMAVLYHLRVMQPLVAAMARVMQRTMGCSGPESLSAAANIFVGQVEAPLVIRPFIRSLSRSELNAIMVGGFATVAGGVMAAYVGMLRGAFPDIAGHLIAASVMSAPAALVVSKVMLPETERTDAGEPVQPQESNRSANVLDAAAVGARDGLMLALNVAAMLVAFLGLVALLNYLMALPALLHNQESWALVREALIGAGGTLPKGCEAPDRAAELAACVRQVGPAAGVSVDVASAWEPWSMQHILGWLMWPMALLIGIAPADCTVVAELLGEKLVLNEFVAFLSLQKAMAAERISDPRSIVLASYALCGFANFGSIAIQIGGISGIAPERRGDLATLGLRAMLGGTLAAMMTACVAGMLL